MGIKQYQDRIDKVLQTYEKPYWEPLSQFARLSEEVGEVSRILNHKYGDKVKKASETPDDLEDELADVLFAVMCLANSENINLDNAIERAIQKMEGRDKDRYPKKSDNI